MYHSKNEFEVIAKRFRLRIKGAAYKITSKFYPTGAFDGEDLYQVGMLALYDATLTTNCEIDTKQFNCYAALKIRGAMIDEMRKLDFVPRSFRDKLDSNSATEYSGIFNDLDDYLDVQSGGDILAELIKNERIEAINDCFSECDSKTRNILYLIYNEGVPQREVARKFRVTASWITQVKNAALKELRCKLKDNHG